MAVRLGPGAAIVAPFKSVAAWYTRTAKAKPLLTAFVTSGLKTSAADMFAQKVIEGREELDLKRHAVFCTFGFFYLGSFQYYLYNIKFAQWCAPLTKTFGHTAVSPVKTFLDQGLHHPFVYFPVFYTMKTVIEGKPLITAWHKYRAEIWDSCKACWSVWVPAQLVNFAFVPRHFRVPYVAMVSFVWTIILSVMQGNFDKAKDGGGSAVSDQLKEAQLAVVGTSYDAVRGIVSPNIADTAALHAIGSPPVAVVPLVADLVSSGHGAKANVSATTYGTAAPTALEGGPSGRKTAALGVGTASAAGVDAQQAEAARSKQTKANSVVEPRLWDLYCRARRSQQLL